MTSVAFLILSIGLLWIIVLSEAKSVAMMERFNQTYEDASDHSIVDEKIKLMVLSHSRSIIDLTISRSIQPHHFVMRAVEAQFSSKSPARLQIWKKLNVMLISYKNFIRYQLVWQAELQPLYGNGVEIINLKEADWFNVTEGMEFGIVYPGSIPFVYSTDCSSRISVSHMDADSLPFVGRRAIFDSLLFPFHVHVTPCDNSNCVNATRHGSKKLISSSEQGNDHWNKAVTSESRVIESSTSSWMTADNKLLKTDPPELNNQEIEFVATSDHNVTGEHLIKPATSVVHNVTGEHEIEHVASYSTKSASFEVLDDGSDFSKSSILTKSSLNDDETDQIRESISNYSSAEFFQNFEQFNDSGDLVLLSSEIDFITVTGIAESEFSKLTKNGFYVDDAIEMSSGILTTAFQDKADAGDSNLSVELNDSITMSTIKLVKLSTDVINPLLVENETLSRTGFDELTSVILNTSQYDKLTYVTKMDATSTPEHFSDIELLESSTSAKLTESLDQSNISEDWTTPNCSPEPELSEILDLLPKIQRTPHSRLDFATASTVVSENQTLDDSSDDREYENNSKGNGTTGAPSESFNGHPMINSSGNAFGLAAMESGLSKSEGKKYPGDENDQVILGLMVWNILLTILLFAVIAALIAAYTSLKKFRRHTSGSYTVNPPNSRRR